MRVLDVGDRVLRRPDTFDANGGVYSREPMRGTVVYVHPKGRFHIVEFGEGAEAVRESFPGCSEK